MADEKEAKKTPAEQFRFLTQGLVQSEGWWRLSVSVSLIGIALWLPFSVHIFAASYVSDAQLQQLRPCYTQGDISCPAAQAIRSHADNVAFGIVLVALVFFAAVPWGIVQIIGWVVEGFRKNSK